MKIIYFLCAVCLMLAGCGSIVNGTTQKVAANSTPAGAKVVALGGPKPVECVTPCTLALKRKYTQTLTITKEGYKPQTATLTSSVSGAVAGNILLGGLIGWGVDASSGGDSKLVPEAVNVTLEQDKPVVDPLATKEPIPAPTQAQNLETELAGIDKMKDEGKVSDKEAAVLRKKAIEKF